MAENNKPIIWYFADPMCSWCWGFSPVIQQLKETYANKIKLALNLGGLRPGTTNVLSQKDREEILYHWHAVHEMTGQEFKFENAMPDGFIYDTEPASRLVTLIASVDPGLTLTCFNHIQSSFYKEGKDVTSKPVLKSIALDLGVSESQFGELFESEQIKQATQQHFNSSYQAGIRGFPALIWQNDEQFDMLCRGYVRFEELSKLIEQHLVH